MKPYDMAIFESLIFYDDQKKQNITHISSHSRDGSGNDPHPR